MAKKLCKKPARRVSVIQRGESVAEGEAVVIPPQEKPDPLSGKKEQMNSLKNNQKKEGEKMALTDVKEVFTRMTEVFNPSAAKGMDAVFQFNITGEGGGNWNVTIKDEACQVQEGTHDSPTTTLTMSAETWLGIVNKTLNSMQAFMSGQLKATGDIMLSQRIEQLFPL